MADEGKDDPSNRPDSTTALALSARIWHEGAKADAVSTANEKGQEQNSKTQDLNSAVAEADDGFEYNDLEIESFDSLQDSASESTDQRPRSILKKAPAGGPQGSSPSSGNKNLKGIMKPTPPQARRPTLDPSRLGSLREFIRPPKHKARRKDKRLPRSKGFIYMVIPPDGGYGWLILLIAFICNVILEGLILSIGILLPHIARELSLNFRQTALLASTQIAPVGSAFINQFGFRPVAVTGALVASAAFYVGSHSHQTVMLVGFYGLLAGTAMGMISICTKLVVNYYFERHRALVSGLASSGIGAGIILMSLLNLHLVSKVGWRNTIRVHVYLLLLVGFLTCSYRELKPTEIEYAKYFSGDDSDESESDEEIATNFYLWQSPRISEEAERTSEVQHEEEKERRRSKRRHGCLSCLCPCCCRKKAHPPTAKTFVINRKPLDRQDIYYVGAPKYGNTDSIGRRKRAEFLVEDNMTQTIDYTLSMARTKSGDPIEEDSRGLMSRLRTAVPLDLNLVKVAEVRFLLLAVFLFTMGLNIPYLYTVVRTEIREDYAHLLPVMIGSMNIVFKICVGLTAFKVNFNPTYMYGISALIGGVPTLASGFTGQANVPFQFVFASCVGIASASTVLRTLVYVRILGLENLTNAFGLAKIVTGMGMFVGTNIAGAMNDHFGGYQVAFIFSGSCMTAAGLLLLCLPCFVEYRKNRQKKVRFTKISITRKWFRDCLDALDVW